MRAGDKQQALSLVLDVLPGQGKRLAQLLRERRAAVQQALTGVRTLHFGRFVMLPPHEVGFRELPDPWQLAFESNFDGELGPHLEELRGALGPLFEEIFGMCRGFPVRADARVLHEFVVTRSLRSEAFYAAYPGLSVKVIHNDATLRRAVDRYLLDRQRAGSLRGRDALGLARALREHLRERAPVENLYIGSVARWFPTAPGLLSVAAERPLQLFLAFVLAPLFELSDWILRFEPRDSPQVRARRAEIGLHEDRLEQNGLTHLVPIKVGAYRLMVLRLMLRAADTLARFGARVGRLGSLGSIHFARWLILPDQRLLFFSNYDGSWESYLGDFIDKASKGLTMIWTNTVDFPRTRLLLWRGARDEEAFKRWTRHHQLPTQIWYSAYPELSVVDVLKNARIRELLAGDLDDARAKELLSIL